jgi:MSHA biogenesis protein MshN
VEPAPPVSAPAHRSALASQLPPAEAHINKRSAELTPQQRAEDEYRSGANLLNQDRTGEAQEKFKTALTHYPEHTGARQALFGLLISAQRTAEAERVLIDGLMLNARQPGFGMALARMQLDRGDGVGAVETLQRAESVAGANATYLAFLAALLQRQDRHAEAIERYRNALALAPNTGVWMMGLGISLHALNRAAEAQDAFRRAKASNALNAELLAFVDERLLQLQRH